MNTPGKARDVYCDNLKTLLIFLVVFAHFTHLNRSILLIGAINNVIYSFHMPLFIFVSGYFSRNIISQRATEIEKILYPYFTFQLLNYLFTKFTALGYGSKEIFIPAFQNWYLLGLFFWRLLVPYCNFYKREYILLFTIVLTFTIGFYEGFNNFLGLYRVIYFFPMFIMGYYCSDIQGLLQKASKYKPYLIGLSVLCLIVIATVSFSSFRHNKLVSLAFTPYSNYNGDMLLFYLRLAGFFSSILISFGLLYLVPKRRFRFTYIGEKTLNIFLLHMFLVFPISNMIGNLSGTMILLVALVASVFICLITSSKWVDRVFAPLTDFSRLKLLVKG